MHNAALARALWSKRPDGVTWEYIYFLEDLQEIDVPIAAFSDVMQYKPTNIIQGFNVYENERALALLDLLEIEAEDLSENLGTAGDFAQTAKILAEIEQMTTTASSKARAEAGPLRNFLFGRKNVDVCDLCGQELPVGFLVAAHIKKRASCNDQEKRDPNIVMRACKLGCDELFERSYIHVDELGKIQLTVNFSTATADLRTAANKLVSRPCKAHRTETKHYFDWHRTHPRRLLK